jgi:hypothetical protein
VANIGKQYDSGLNSSSIVDVIGKLPLIFQGNMDIRCTSCGAMPWKEETKKLCCGDGIWIVEQGLS